MEWDDGSLGTFNSIHTFKNKTFTDGCNKQINYRGGIGVIGKNWFTLNENSNMNGVISYPEIIEMISYGWDISNHSMLHRYDTGTDTPNSLGVRNELIEWNRLFWDRTGYRMNTIIVPVNYPYFVVEGDSLGFICATTQGAKDGYAIYTINTNQNSIPDGFAQLDRWFTDDWSQSYIETTLKVKIDSLMSAITPIFKPFFRIGTHTNLYEQYPMFINYLHAASDDKIWVTTMREWFEYRYLKNNAIKTDSLHDNRLEININLSSIPEHIRWRDLSLKVTSDSRIVSVIANNVDSFTFNSVTGLINLYKEKNVFLRP